MKIILIGYMGCGKTTIGKVLAKKNNFIFIDLDEFIEKKEQKNISQIFTDNGEIYFRKKEHKYLKEILLTKKNIVLSLGGGTPCYANNMKLLLKSKKNITIYLKAKVSTIINRLKKDDGKRPLISKIDNTKINEYISKHLFERNYYYNQSKIKISVDEKSINDIVNELSFFK